MTSYEKMLRIMRRQSKQEAEQGVRLGVITSGLGLQVGDLELEREDLLIAHHLLTGWCYGGGEDPPTVGALEEGDKVLCKRLNETTWAVIARVR